MVIAVIRKILADDAKEFLAVFVSHACEESANNNPGEKRFFYTKTSWTGAGGKTFVALPVAINSNITFNGIILQLLRPRT